MEGLAEALHEAGYETLSVPYASFRKSMNEIVDDVEAELRKVDDGKMVHVVTHSMGGIVLRYLVERVPELVQGKVVMLAPPNQGSEIIDWLDQLPIKSLVRRLVGPGGMELATHQVRKKVPGFSAEREVAVVMGRKWTVPFFTPLLDGEHDGIVSVERGKVEGMSEMEVLNVDHTFMMAEGQVREKVLSFLDGSEVSR